MTKHARFRTFRYASVLARWLALAAVVFLLTMATGAYVTDHALKRVYRAQVVMEVEPTPLDGARDSTWFSSPAQQALRAERDEMESLATLAPVVAKLDLTAVWAARLYRQADPLRVEEAVRRLKGDLQIEFTAGSDVVTVGVFSDDAREAAAIANALAESNAQARAYRASSPFYVGSANPAVRVLVPATPPTVPIRPDRIFCYRVTTALAAALAVMLATCVEVVLLIVRAEQAQRALELAPVHH